MYTEIPTYPIWLKDNPGKSINDYYQQFPPNRNKDNEEKIEKPDSSFNSTLFVHEQQLLLATEKKNIGVSILLSFLFGPFGLFYVTVEGALIMIAIPVIALVFGFIIHNQDPYSTISMLLFGSTFLMLLCYIPFCILYAIIATEKYNREIYNNFIRQIKLKKQ